MCGSIRRSIHKYQAVEYALAYSASYASSGETDEHGDIVPLTLKQQREHAQHFIENYVPADQRAGATKLLAERADEFLEPTLRYWADVIS